MDLFELLIVAILLTLVGGGSFLVGKLLDPVFQVKQRRRFLRENCIVVGLVSKDRRGVDRVAVNTDGTRIKYKNSIIAIDHNHIYREDKPEQGFFFKKDHIKYDEGAPTVYIYSDSMKPADFFDEPSKVSAEDVATVLISFVRIELMKGIAAVKLLETLVIIGVVLAFLSLMISSFGTFTAIDAKNAAGACVANTNSIMTFFGISTNGTIAVAPNNTIVVRGS